MLTERKCEKCGTIRFFYPADIRNRPLRFCKACKSESVKTHGGSKTRLYRLWRSMLNRCSLSSDTNYIRYGAKGVRVCKEWKTFIPFRDWAFMHGYTDVLSIERRNPTGNYSPQNCCWIPRHEQAMNTRVSKLNWQKVAEIRRLHKLNQPRGYCKAKCTELGNLYNVHPSMISYVIRKKSWVASNQLLP